MQQVGLIFLVIIVGGAGCTEDLGPAIDATTAADVRALEASCSPAALTELDGR